MADKTFAFVSQFPTYRLTGSSYGIQGSMAGQLVEYQKRLSALFGTSFKVLLVAPACSKSYYQANRGNFVEVSDAVIQNALIFPDDAGRTAFFLKHFLPSMVRLQRALRPADIVCTGLSYDLWHPICFMALVIAAIMRKRIFYISDGDWRASAEQARQLGTISLKSFLLCKYLYDPIRALQIRLGVRYGDLVMLKGLDYVRDFGRGADKVKFYLDSSASREHLIPREELERKVRELRAGNGKLRLIYFGRMVHYKGIDYMIEAIHQLPREVKDQVELQIMGFGEEAGALQAQIERLQLQDCVRFIEPRQYGQQLFEQLYPCHVLLACPRDSVDTPRSAIDAMAAGLHIIAFDTEYYRSLQGFGAAVTLVPWLSVQDVAAAIARFAADRACLAGEFSKARDFAEANTMEIWLDRITRWVHRYCG
jgi:glycosyltransferase involved in cell wall biosynthesis